MKSKTLLHPDVADWYFNKNKIYAFDFADDDSPNGGCAYWKWVAFKINGELHILEAAFAEDKMFWVLGIVNY